MNSQYETTIIATRLLGQKIDDVFTTLKEIRDLLPNLSPAERGQILGELVLQWDKLEDANSECSNLIENLKS
ncbi:MAG: hypothetical protein SNJ57_19440 [Cyanobacteriota bacterium]